jgi:TonB family protein
MHELEREALDDPFLMDALQGYEETAGKDQQPNLNELSERLQQRTSEKRGRIIPWKTWSIAASVLVALTIGGLWLKKSPPAEKEKTADVVLPELHKAIVEPSKDTLKAAAPMMQAPLIAQDAKPAPVLKPASKPSEKAVYQQEISAADANVPASTDKAITANEPPPPMTLREVLVKEDKKDNTQRLSEAVVMGYTSKSKQDSIDYVAALSKRTKVAASSTTMLPGKVAGLTVIPADPKTQAEAQRITGIIISKGDGSPVIGAAIRVRGTNKSTVTNTAGHFALPVSGKAQTLDIVSIGYEHKQVSVKGGDSLKVELNQDSQALSEVVVTKKEGGDEPAAESAHPQDGWSAFKKYLQANAFLPDGTTGSVSVTFTVATDGTLSDIKIKKSLNTTADQKAIDLIKAGPSWIGNNNQKPEQVTVKVKFQKSK